MTLQRGETTVILKHVPADICENCGEYYLSSEVTARLIQKAESAVKNGTEVEICQICRVRKVGWEAGTRTPIRRSRVCSLTIRRPPKAH